MLTNGPGRLGQDQEGLSLANVLCEGLVCGLIILDAQKKIASCTDEAAQMLCLDAGQAARKSYEVLPAPLRQIIRLANSSGKPIANRQANLAIPGRGKTTLRLSAVPLLSGKKKSGLVVVLNDFTWAKTLDHNLRRLDRLASVGTLSASMAHEIKNALVAVKTFVDLLIQQNKDAELASTVNREISRIDSIVSQILRFAGPAKPTFSS